MAEILDDNERKKLYRKMLAESSTSNSTKKYSFNEFEKKLLNDKDLVGKIADIAVKRNWASDDADFYNRYFPEFSQKAAPAVPPAAPVAKPAAAPVAAAPIEQAAPIPSVEPMEEEEIPEVEYEGQMLPEVTAYGNLPKPGTQLYEEIMRTNPPVGSDEYNLKIAVQNQLPPVELGAGGYGGVLQAPFETTAQIEQEAQSPAFRRQKLAEAMMQGEVPVVTQQGVRKAQEGFRKATKEQQQAAIMGSPGYEYEQERKAQERGVGEATGNLFGAFGADADRLTESILSGMVNSMAEQIAAQRTVENPAYLMDPTKWEEGEKKYKGIVKEANKRMFQEAKSSEEEFRNEIAKRNIQTSILDAVNKGKYNRVPEALLYTIGDAAMQMGAALASRGGSMYFQTLPMEYKDEVEAIARETNRTPEQVIAAGDDAPFVAKVSSIGQAVFERIGANQISKGIGNKGGYKAVRDWLIKGTKNKTLARAGGLAFVAGAEAGTEGIQTGISQVATLSTSQKPFMDKVDRYFSPEFKKARLESEIAGAIGGGFLGGAGRAVTKAFEKGPDITQFSPEVQGNEILQEAARGYQDNIAKAEEQGRKPDAYNKRELNKLATDPEAWVKGEIKYLTQTIQDNKKNNIDSKVEETKLARANALLAQIKAEKKGMEQAALAPAQEAAPVAPEAPVAPAETITAPEITTPAVTIPAAPAVSDAEMDANIEEGQKRAGFVYESPLESLTGDAKSIIKSVGKNKYISLAPVKELFAELYDAYKIFARQRASTARNLTTAQIEQGSADFEEALGLLGDYISQRDSGKFVREYTGRKQQEEAAPEVVAPEAPVTENAPVTEEAPVAEETIPVAPETEEDYSFLEETELTPEEEAALLAQEEAAPVAPVQVFRPELPTIQVPKAEGFAPALRKLGYTDDEISKMTIEQQQDIVINKTEPARAESSSKVDVAKENQRLERVAEAQRKIDEEIAAEEAAQAAPVEEVAPEVAPQAPAAPLGGEVDRADLAGVVKTRLRKEGVSQEERNRLTGTRENPIITSATKADYEALLKSYTANKEKQLADFEEQGGEEGKFIPEKGIFLSSDTSFWDGKIKAVEQYLKNQAEPAPAPKGKVEVVFPTTFEATEVKPYAEVEDNYYRPDQQLKFNQGTYEPVRIIAHPDIIRAMSIGSKLRDNNKRKTVTNQEIEFADGIAKRLGFTTESGKGGAIMLHNAARELAKQNRSNTNETFVVIGEEQGGKKKPTPAPKTETKQEAPKTETKKEEAPKTEAKPVSTTPQEGATVEIPAQRAEFGTRNMVFKDGEWKQNVGGDILKVGPAVQQQAQEAFAGKEETKPAETKEGKKPAPKEEWIGKTKEQYISDRTSEILAASENYQKKIGSKDKADQKTAAYLRDEAGKKAEQEYDKLFSEALKNKTLPNEYKPNYLLTSTEKVHKDKKRYTEAGYPQNHNEKLSREEHKEEVQSAVDNGLYAKAIEDGVLSYDEAAKIIESSGIKVPQSLISTPSSTTSLASQVEDMRSLPPAKRKAAQQALEERYGKEDVAKMIEITANFTKIIDDLEQRGVVKIDCP